MPLVPSWSSPLSHLPSTPHTFLGVSRQRLVKRIPSHGAWGSSDSVHVSVLWVPRPIWPNENRSQHFILTHSYPETRKRVIGKQCKLPSLYSNMLANSFWPFESACHKEIWLGAWPPLSLKVENKIWLNLGLDYDDENSLVHCVDAHAERNRF